MELNIKERLAISGLLPKEGNMVTLIIAKDVKNKVELTQELIKEIGFKIVGKRYIWDADKKLPDIEFTKAEIKVLQDSIKELEKQKKLLLDNVDLYVKINDWKEPEESNKE